MLEIISSGVTVSFVIDQPPSCRAVHCIWGVIQNPGLKVNVGNIFRPCRISGGARANRFTKTPFTDT